MNNEEKLLPPPRVAALHDLSCLGRCALTVIIPTLSVMGYQVIPVPTALLSTHTGGYTDLYFRDLTEDMQKISSHFLHLGTRFHSIYTGFLGSAEQIRTVESFIDTFSALPDESGKKPLIFVDPVMGDDGELYSTYTPELAEGIRKLSLRADVLTPNLTEAARLAGVPYLDTATLPPQEALGYVENLLAMLVVSHPSCRIVITGILLSDGSLCNLGRDSNGHRFTVRHDRCPVSYPGTGDLFASVLLGELLGDKPFESAVTLAADFVRTVTERSTLINSETRAGVSLEPELHRLIQKNI